MTIELEAQITTGSTLAEVLADADRVLLPVPHNPFALRAVLPASEVMVGPFPVPEHGPLRYKDDYTSWEHGYLEIVLGPIAEVSLAVRYIAFLHEREPFPGRPPTTSENTEDFGYNALIHAGGFRTRASFCLAALLISTIATRNRSRIIDDVGRLKHGRAVDPAVITALFVKHRDAPSFEELADAFCDEINFAPDWARAAEELARHKS